MLVEHSIGSNTNNTWTPPLAIHSKHVTTKRLWWWVWVHWIVFMTSLYIYFVLSFVLVEHYVGSNTNNAWTPPLAVHSWHVTTKPLWWWGWAHWMSSWLHYIYTYIYTYIHIYIYSIVGMNKNYTFHNFKFHICLRSSGEKKWYKYFLRYLNLTTDIDNLLNN